MTGKDGKLYLQNPTNQYVSQFVDEFNDCLRCGSTQHLFKFSPRKEDITLRNIFVCRKFGISFLLLGKKRPTFCFLPIPPIQLTTSFRKFLGLLRVRNPKLTLLFQLLVHNPNLTQLYAK